MYIKIPDKKVALPLLCTPHKVLDGDCLIETDDDTRGVEDEEHDHSDDENDGEIAVFLLLIYSVPGRFRS